ncbi:LOW QUALITY PROTEIN: scopoletin glucosyltransferase-like [Neltuma alba]|uniref:LOW QUALITY PROTEIN: scopoletin glucosyltransferase-like n=1 Tax=Neltuma alba TaxID=207710 RepID=UPI0010A4D9BC|nr:LOW QUALITY PROTEIN: scopoletin glucosyltransferase-like [Prosopis alba]
MASEGQNHRLHIFFFPFPAHGHMIPTVDMAKLFAGRGVRATIVTTPLNLPLISRSIQESIALGLAINLVSIKFPCAEAGLPEGCENADAVSSYSMVPAFFEATTMLQEPLEQLLREHHPDCLIAGSFFPWATDSATKFGIPRIVFHGTGFFPLCVSESITAHQPFKDVVSDSDPFVIPNLPGVEIQMTRKILPSFFMTDEDTFLTRMFKAAKQSVVKSFGVVVNSFYELEGIYADHYKKVLGRKAWHIGPVSLCNTDNKEKSYRGKQASMDAQDCLKWLDSKKPNSVLYICFGSRSDFTENQLREIAMGLEASGQNFIWVVRKSKKGNKEEGDGDQDEGWLPEGFEKRIEGKGLIIRGWAPQVLILDHEATGGFVTHCGWNSTLEGVSAGVPMVTWPVSAEQFYNEKLITEVLRIGVAVGVKKWVPVVGDYIEKEAVGKAVKAIMEGEEAEEMRNRAKKLARMARETVEEGGSSYSDLNSLIEELADLSK